MAQKIEIEMKEIGKFHRIERGSLQKVDQYCVES